MPRRIPKYLSPSAISIYRKDREAYYVRYAAEGLPVEENQTQAMSIGSSFDAYAKSYLHEALFGKGKDPKYAFDAIFEAQVQPQWRDWANLHGMYVFEQYRKSGALADLLLSLQQAANEPRFEIDIMGVINNQREPMSRQKGGVTFLGKPDVFYINSQGAHVIIDWKVNGYVSANRVSPFPGYVKIRGAGRREGECHPDCQLKNHFGVMINAAIYLNQLNVDWATQLSIYSWLAGTEVGDDFIAGIDQVCCAPTSTEFPELRFAEHRTRVERSFQYDVFNLAQEIWTRVHSDHFFADMPYEDSEARCKLLDTHSVDLSNLDQDFLDMTSTKWKGYR